MASFLEDPASVVFQAAKNRNNNDKYDLLLFGVSSGEGVAKTEEVTVPVLLLAEDCPGLDTYLIDVSDVCQNGCGISAVVGDTGGLEGFDAPGGYDTIDSSSNVLLLRAGDHYYLALRPSPVEENKAVTVVLRHPTPRGITSTPVRVVLVPNAITPGLLGGALTGALKQPSPEPAQQAVREKLLDELTKGYNSRVHPLVVPPDAGDEEARSLVKSALLSCGGDNTIPVRILDRYNRLEKDLRLLVTGFDLGQEPFEEQHFALCVDKETREVLGLENTCYGKYIDEVLLRELFNPGALVSYSAACGAATLACGFLMQDWKALLADVVAVCGLPSAWVAFHPPGDLAERLRSGGDVGLVFAGGLGGEVLGGGVLGAAGVGLFRAARPYSVRQLAEFYYRARAVEGSGLLGGLRVPGLVSYDTGAVVEEIARALGMSGGEQAVRAVLDSAPTATRAEARLAVLGRIYGVLPQRYRTQYLDLVRNEKDPLTAFQRLITESRELLDDQKADLVSRVSGSLFGDRGEGLLKYRRQGSKLIYNGREVGEGEALSTEQALQDYARLRGDSEAARTAEEAAARYISEADDLLEARTSPTRSVLKGLKESLICGAAGALAGTLTYTSLTPAALTGITLPALTLSITGTSGKITSLKIGSLTVGEGGTRNRSPGPQPIPANSPISPG